jgi:hypothetical protein
MRNPVVSAVFGLTCFYWAVLFVVYWSQNDWTLPPGWLEQTLWRFKFLGVCILMGVVLTLVYQWVKRQFVLISLMGDEERGITCTIGPLPKPDPPARAKKPVDLAALRLPNNAEHWFEDWKRSMLELEFDGKKLGQPHVNLAHALIQILGNTPTVPAFAPRKHVVSTHAAPPPDLLALARRRAKDPDAPLPPSLLPTPEVAPSNRHGTYTLLEHSYAVAFEALKLAPSWSFEAARDQLRDETSKPRIFAKKVREDYTWDPEDALIPLIGLIHDLGKIHTFERAEDGSFSDTGQDHDFWSAVLLGRIPEFWELPRLDRDALSFAVSTYHRPRKFSRATPPMGMEDRAFTLQHLLIQADRRAGLQVAKEIEAAAFKARGEESEPGAASNAAQAGLWKAFCALLNEPGRVAVSNGPRRIGFKSVLDGSPVLFLHGGDLQKELWKTLSMEDRAALGASYRNTRPLLLALLETLDAQSILVRSNASTTLPAEESFWRLALKGRDPARVAPLAEWQLAVVIKASQHFPALAYGPDAECIPVFLGPGDPLKLNPDHLPETSVNVSQRRQPVIQGDTSDIDLGDIAPTSTGATAPNGAGPSDSGDVPPTSKVDPRIAQIRKQRQATISGGSRAPGSSALAEPSDTDAALGFFSHLAREASRGSITHERLSDTVLRVLVGDILDCSITPLRVGVKDTARTVAVSNGQVPGVRLVNTESGPAYDVNTAALAAASKRAVYG